MPEYVLTENGNIKITDGKPTVKGDDGKEYTVDALGAQEKITSLNAEAAGYRKKASERKATLEGIPQAILDDPKAAAEAITTVGNLGADHKVQMDKMKADLDKSYQTALTEKDDKITKLGDKLFESNVKGKFATSKAISGTVLPPGIAFATFKGHFNQDGSANDAAGNMIYSKEKPGEPAGFEEAMGHIIENYPDKDAILKGTGAHGSGATGGQGDHSGSSESKTSHDLIKAGLDKRSK